MVFMIFFGFLVTVMIITVLVANSVLRKRDVDQIKTLVSGRVTQMGEMGYLVDSSSHNMLWLGA